MITNNDVIRISREQGFDLVGFAKAEPLEEEFQKYSSWIGHGYQAGMKYMERTPGKRKDVKEVFPDAVSVISLGLNYYSPKSYSGNKSLGKVSKYALGKDYHLVMWEKLFLIIQKLKETDQSFDAISYVDTGPVMDKVWSVKAGIGWQGKHTNIINKEYGSWFFIANIITNYSFQYSEQIADFCGTCTACIDACPTNAIIEPYVLDSNKCISYLTIENKSDIPSNLKGKFENWIFGCDICQDVCPWNTKNAENTLINEFYDMDNKAELDLEHVLSLSEEEFNSLFETSPVKRAKLKGLKRNAAFIKESKP